MLLTYKLMAEVLAQWVIALTAIAGVGWTVEMALKRNRDAGSYLETLWLGLGGITSVIYALNLFTGLVGWQMKILISCFIALGARDLSRFEFLKTLRKRRITKLDICLGVFAAATTLLLMNLSIGSGQKGDSSVYHIGLVDYAAKYSVIPGLANLHSRFGFNSTTYQLSAVFQNGLWGVEGFRLANGFICVLVLLEVVKRIRKIVRSGYGDVSDYILLLGLNIVVYSAIWIPNTAISSPNPDLPAALMLLVAITYSSSAFLKGGNMEYGLAFSLAVLSFTFRPLTAPLVIFLFVLLVKRTLTSKRIDRLLVITVGMASFLILMVVLRSIIISGYVYYPSTFRLDGLDWAVPKSSAEIDLKAIEAWAKTPSVPYEQVLQSNSWVSGWISRWKQYFLLPSITIVIGCLVLVIAARYNLKELFHQAPKKLISVVLISILFWGYSAPDPRFAVGLVAVVIALPASWGLTLLSDCRLSKFSVAHVALLSIIGAQFSYIALTPTYPYSSLLNKASERFDSGLVPFQGAPTKSVVLESGLVIQIPTEDGGCFRIEMCTIGVNSMNEGLVLRGTDISDGFRIKD